MSRFPFLLLAAAFVMPGYASAQPSLVSASPAAGSTVSDLTKLSLTFSEPPSPALTGVDLVMTGMPGMAAHKPMPIRGFTISVSGKQLTIVLPRRLPAGSYQLSWHAAGQDAQRAQDSLAFTVK